MARPMHRVLIKFDPSFDQIIRIDGIEFDCSPRKRRGSKQESRIQGLKHRSERFGTELQLAPANLVHRQPEYHLT